MPHVREYPTNPFLPDQIIELADATELPAFENIVAETIVPNMAQNQRIDWDCRPKLGDMLKPPNFNGRLVDIELEPYADPYERLVNACQEGWRLSGGGFRRTSTASVETIPFFRGFLLTANARSTGKGIRGHIRAGVWYGLHPAQAINRDGTLSVNSAMSICPIKRYVTRAEYDKNQFRQAHDDARRIGFQILRQQMKQAIRTPHRG